ETVFGRRLYLADIHARNQGLRAGAERAAINAPMQGTAADIIKRAMIDIDGWLAGHRERALMVLQVHDELVFEVDEGFVETLLAEVPRRMTAAAELRVPLVVDSGVGKDWDEAHWGASGRPKPHSGGPSESFLNPPVQWSRSSRTIHVGSGHIGRDGCKVRRRDHLPSPGVIPERKPLPRFRSPAPLAFPLADRKSVV